MNARALRKEQISHLVDSSDSKVDLSEWAEKLTDHQQQQKARQTKKCISFILKYFLLEKHIKHVLGNNFPR